MGLIEDAKAAQEAGMSYGTYKARDVIVAVKRPSGKVCSRCGKQLLPMQYKYCSARCREDMKAIMRKGDWLV